MKNQLKSAFAVGCFAMAATGAVAQERPRVNLNQPQQVQAPGITYTYAGVRYINQSIDSDFECDQDGINLFGSLDLKDGFFAKASYSDVSGNNNCGSSSFLAGAGYHTAYSDSVDMYATVSFVSVSEGDNDSGLEFAGGMRTFLTEVVEGRLELYHGTYGLEETGIRGTVDYWLNDAWTVNGGVSLGSDSTTFGIGARYAF